MTKEKLICCHSIICVFFDTGKDKWVAIDWYDIISYVYYIVENSWSNIWL